VAARRSPHPPPGGRHTGRLAGGEPRVSVIILTTNCARWFVAMGTFVVGWGRWLRAATSRREAVSKAA